MRIGILLPSILASKRYREGRIFAPLYPAVDLANGLVDKGHEVFFYTSKDVETKAQIVAGDTNLTDKEPFYYQFRYRDPQEQKYTAIEIVKRDFEYDLTLKAYKDALEKKLDIIHSYHDFGAHYFNELTNFPTVYTLHDLLPQSDDTIEYARFSKFTHHKYISISNSQRKSILKLNFADNIYHGVNLGEYEFSQKAQNYLVYFGRLIEDKGPDIAIQAAMKLRIPIHVASGISKANIGETYSKEKIEPFVNNTDVVMRGYLTGKDKSDFIKSAIAYILPLRWDEPFGLTMIESMACGTPVIAYNRGSVSEIVRDGVTGFIIDPDNEDRPGKGTWVIKKQGMEGLIEAVNRIGEIDRSACRKHVEENFSVDKMVEGYERVYEKVIGESKNSL